MIKILCINENPRPDPPAHRVCVRRHAEALQGDPWPSRRIREASHGLAWHTQCVRQPRFPAILQDAGGRVAYRDAPMAGIRAIGAPTGQYPQGERSTPSRSSPRLVAIEGPSRCRVARLRAQAGRGASTPSGTRSLQHVYQHLARFRTNRERGARRPPVSAGPRDGRGGRPARSRGG